jgi:hypothetical protein
MVLLAFLHAATEFLVMKGQMVGPQVARPGETQTVDWPRTVIQKGTDRLSV